MKGSTNTATIRFSGHTSGSEYLSSNLTEARRNAPTYDTDQMRVPLRHYRCAGLRRTAVVSSM